ncbi:hypothetical protein FN846DRAFT_1002471 [Sphaerosporella brunnea]|uniref:Uncharacterized protein n=1 Tax=Sphaerosporella brunnea TaxID=1250544 RepID=A0A5J5EFK0_9PEZI|nr:hypothetical protein FN846DRAFT_1002471 [Sphaerosporella brunnea]
MLLHHFYSLRRELPTKELILLEAEEITGMEELHEYQYPTDYLYWLVQLFRTQWVIEQDQQSKHLLLRAIQRLGYLWSHRTGADPRVLFAADAAAHAAGNEPMEGVEMQHPQPSETASTTSSSSSDGSSTEDRETPQFADLLQLVSQIAGPPFSSEETSAIFSLLRGANSNVGTIFSSPVRARVAAVLEKYADVLAGMLQSVETYIELFTLQAVVPTSQSIFQPPPPPSNGQEWLERFRQDRTRLLLSLEEELQQLSQAVPDERSQLLIRRSLEGLQQLNLVTADLETAMASGQTSSHHRPVESVVRDVVARVRTMAETAQAQASSMNAVPPASSTDISSPSASQPRIPPTIGRPTTGMLRNPWPETDVRDPEGIAVDEVIAQSEQEYGGITVETAPAPIQEYLWATRALTSIIQDLASARGTTIDLPAIVGDIAIRAIDVFYTCRRDGLPPLEVYQLLFDAKQKADELEEDDDIRELLEEARKAALSQLFRPTIYSFLYRNRDQLSPEQQAEHRRAAVEADDYRTESGSPSAVSATDLVPTRRIYHSWIPVDIPDYKEVRKYSDSLVLERFMAAESEWTPVEDLSVLIGEYSLGVVTKPPTSGQDGEAWEWEYMLWYLVPEDVSTPTGTEIEDTLEALNQMRQAARVHNGRKWAEADCMSCPTFSTAEAACEEAKRVWSRAAEKSRRGEIGLDRFLWEW